MWDKKLGQPATPPGKAVSGLPSCFRAGLSVQPTVLEAAPAAPKPRVFRGAFCGMSPGLGPPAGVSPPKTGALLSPGVAARLGAAARWG